MLALVGIVMLLPGWVTSMDLYWEETFDSQGFDEGRSIATTNNSVVVGGFSRGFNDEYHILIYNSTGNLVWRRDIDGSLWDKNMRNIALAVYNDTFVLSCTDRTFLTMSYAFNGTRLWEHTWGTDHSVSDLTLDETGAIYVLGCSANPATAFSTVLKYTPNGTLLWNTTLAGCGWGIDAYNDLLFVAGEHDGQAVLYALNRSGVEQWNHTYGEGTLFDVDMHEQLYVLHTHNRQASLIKCHPNGTIIWTQKMSGEREVHDLAVDEQGTIFIAGAVYNQTSRDDDFLVAGFMANGTELQHFQRNGAGSQKDSAWAVCTGTDGFVVATGYIVDKDTYPGPPPYVQFNRNIYTTSLERQNLPPNVNFTWDPISPKNDETVTFAELSYDPDGTIATWTWDFGDSKLSTLQEPTHEYKKSGTYLITLTVTDDDGEARSLTKIIEVKEADNGIPGFELILVLLAAALVLLRRK